MNTKLVRDLASLSLLAFALVLGLFLTPATAGSSWSCQQPQYDNCVVGCQQDYDQCAQVAGAEQFMCHNECLQECWEIRDEEEREECLFWCELLCDDAWYDALDSCSSDQAYCETDCYDTWC